MPTGQEKRADGEVRHVLPLTAALTRLPKASQSSHQNPWPLDMNLDQTRSTMAVVGKMIMKMDSVTRLGPRFGLYVGSILFSGLPRTGEQTGSSAYRKESMMNSLILEGFVI